MRVLPVPLSAWLLLTACQGCGGSDDLCAGVACDQPPASVCLDADTLRTFASPGQCQAATGQCSYAPSEQACEFGCDQGVCLAQAPSLWGWISVLELNEATLNAPWTWLSGVRAYFARAPHCRNFPEHRLEACGPPLAAEGACSLYGRDWQDPWRCGPACDLDTQECADVDGLPTCLDLPASWNVGALQVTGLAAPVSLGADELNRYGAGSLPADLFGAGDVLEVRSDGGELAPLSVQGVGVAHLEIGSASVPLVRGQPALVSWTPADPGSRVQVLLEAGPHHPAPPVAALLCDAPDEDGQLDIPAALVATFLDRAYCVCRFSHITRYRQATLPTQGGEVELRVGSVRQLQLERR